MMNLKNKKSMILILAVVLVAIVVIAVVGGAGRKNGSEGQIPDILVKTSFCELHYPGNWKEQVRIETASGDQSECISFTAVTQSGEAKMFDIIFGQSEALYVGDVASKDGTRTAVYLNLYELEDALQWMQEDQFAFYAMQEDVNYLISHLPLEVKAETQLGSVAVPGQEDAVEDIQIETPFAVLHYPGEWRNALRLEYLEGEDYGIAFYGQPLGLQEYRLFDVFFRVDLGTGLGVLETDAGEKRAVDLVFYSIDPKPEWTENQTNAIFAMQEDANDMIRELNLSAIEQSAGKSPVETAPGYTHKNQIQTPYGALEYSEKWGKEMQVKVNESEGYVVMFVAELPGREPIALFDVVFGEKGQIGVGKIAGADGTQVPVMVNIYEFEFSGAWTAEEKDMVYEMAEEINYVLEYLSQRDDVILN